VFNLCLNYVQNYEDAQEITQDVFVSIHQSFEKFRNESNVETWIYRISINKCLDFIRARQRKKRFAFFYFIIGGDETSSIKQLSEFNHPGIAMEQKERMAFLFNCINALPENQKTALILNKLEEKKQQEIAEIMQISAKAVESLIQRAKLNLLKSINNTKD
jgi:RNA polymerase sigma factor (sigma-70 family)